MSVHFLTSFTWNRDMKSFFALYVKELKANKILFLFLLLLIAGMNAYGIMQISYVRHFKDVIESSNNLPFILWPNFSYFWPMLAVFTLVLSLPFLLAHAFNTEWKSETHYQMFALPDSQYTVILAKIAAITSVGIVGGGIVICSLYLWMVSKAEFVDGVSELMSFPAFYSGDWLDSCDVYGFYFRTCDRDGRSKVFG